MTQLLRPPARRPASFYQRDWVLACQDGRSYFRVPLAWDLAGPLDVDALTRAIGDLVQRHDALRTAFAVRGDEVEQLVWPSVDVDLTIVDCTADSTTMDDRIAAESEQGRLVAVPPLWHGLLFRRAANRHVLVLFMNHLIFDGWSHAVLHDELVRCYRAAVSGRPPRLPALAMQAGDHARWERDVRDDAAESWWRENLRSLPPLAALPSLGGRFIAASLPAVPAAQVQALRELAAEQGASLNTALLAIVFASRRAITGDDAVIGVTRAGRDGPGRQRIVGPLLDHVPVRVDMAGADTFPEVLRRTCQAYQEATARTLPLGRIREIVPDDLTRRRGRVHDTRYNYLPTTTALHATVSTPDGGELSLSLYELDPLLLSPRYTEDHPEVLPLSFVLRRRASGDVGGEVCGHEGQYAMSALADVAAAFDETLRAAVGGRSAALAR